MTRGPSVPRTLGGTTAASLSSSWNSPAARTASRQARNLCADLTAQLVAQDMPAAAAATTSSGAPAVDRRASVDPDVRSLRVCIAPHPLTRVCAHACAQQFPLPAGWQEFKDERTGVPYYVDVRAACSWAGSRAISQAGLTDCSAEPWNANVGATHDCSLDRERRAWRCGDGVAWFVSVKSFTCV